MDFDESELNQALRAAQDPPDQLLELSRRVQDSAVETAAEAREIVGLVKQLPGPTPPDRGISDLHCFVPLFQPVRIQEVFDVLADDGWPELYRLFDLLIFSKDSEIQQALLFLENSRALQNRRGRATCLERRSTASPSGRLAVVDHPGTGRTGAFQRGLADRETAESTPPLLCASGSAECRQWARQGMGTRPFFASLRHSRGTSAAS